jgi:selenoprotein W-related protein
MAQELLSTFGAELGEVSLQPGTGGVFVIAYNGEVIWDRKTNGSFPDVKQLKQRVRDHLDPNRDLGHLDRLSGDQSDRAPSDGPS